MCLDTAGEKVVFRNYRHTEGVNAGGGGGGGMASGLQNVGPAASDDDIIEGDGAHDDDHDESMLGLGGGAA